MRTRRSGLTALAAVSLVFVLVVAMTTSGCGESADVEEGPLTLTETDNGDSFTVQTGATIVVVLPGNPTTGYSWASVMDDESAALLKQEGEPVYAEDSTDETLVGGGGAFTFTFTAVSQGEATLKLAYARSWEADVEPDQTFEASVSIE